MEKNRMISMFVWILCFSMIGMGILVINDVKAQTVITVGDVGLGDDFNTIEDATDWVTTDNSDTSYLISVTINYNPALESFPISINMQVVNPLKSVEIVGYPTTITLGPANPVIIFDVSFDMGYENQLAITDFTLVGQSTSADVVYIHDSKNVVISQCQIGGSSNYHCKNGISAIDSENLRFHDLTVTYCSLDGIYMYNIDNLDNQAIYRGVDDCDILNNDGDGLTLSSCNEIRVVNTYFRYNLDNGINLISSDNCIFYSGPTYTINDNGECGIKIYGICDSTHIKDYTIYDNDIDGILFDGVIPSSSSNRNIVEDVIIYSNERDGIGIRESAYINIIEENTKIYDNDVGIYLTYSHDVRIDLDKMDISDPSSLYNNNYGIFCYYSYYLDIGNVILSNNRLGMNSHINRGESVGFVANIAVLSCFDFYIWDYIFIIGHDSGNNGIYMESCEVQNYARNIVSLVKLQNFDISSYYGIILSSTSDTYIHFYKDLDGLTESILYIIECSDILIEDIDFERGTSTNYFGITITNSFDIILRTSQDGLSYGYGNIKYFAEAICIMGSYNVEINDVSISNCDVGIGIYYGDLNDDPGYYNIDIIDVSIDLCDIGIWTQRMYDSTGGVAVEITDSKITGSGEYGILMEGSEVTLDNTDVLGYGSWGVYNEYHTDEYDQHYPGYLIVESDCEISDSLNNPDIITKGYSLSCKAESYDYFRVSTHVEIGNTPPNNIISVYSNI